MTLKRFVSFLIPMILLVAAEIAAKPYRGAELRTNQAYTYGRYAVRYQSAPGAGQTSTFFTYHDGGIEWNEIDIEILGRYSDDIQFNTITPGQTNHVSHSYLNFHPHIDFHTYAFEWTPEYVAWFVDGEEVHRQTDEHIQTLVHPQKIMMNIWPPVYADWVGELDPKILPVFAYYDWVEYASYTPGEGDTGTDNNFTSQWHDDFDTWNRDRWSKATHTWGGNNSTFTPDNIHFQDGLMILCLTDSVNIGYQDRNRPDILWARGRDSQVTAKFSEPVGEETAETVGNYSIAGVTISGAELQPDGQTVVLNTSGMDRGSAYQLVCFNVKDTPPGNNTLLGANVNIRMDWSPDFPLHINVGGDTLGSYFGDQLWDPEVDYGYQDGANRTLSRGIDIAGTTLDSVYRDYREGLVAYRIRLPNGTYPVKLMFSENRFTEPEQRSFDVYIEGARTIDNLDLVTDAGEKTAQLISRENVEVRDGILDIHFSDTPHAGAVLNGITIEAPTTEIHNQSGVVPGNFQCSPAYPNPFNAATTFTYSMDAPGFVSAQILDLRGYPVTTIIHREMEAGRHSLRWNAGHSGSGMYLFRISAEINETIYRDIHKILYVK